MKNLNRKVVQILFGVAVLTFCGLFVSTPVMAIPEEATTKALREMVKQCYINDEMEPEVSVKNSLDASDIVRVSDKYLLPNFNSIGKTQMTCRELFFGDGGSWGGILKAYGDVDVAFRDPTKLKEMMEDYLQYTGDITESVTQRCFTINMTAMWDMSTVPQMGRVSSDQMCVPVDEAGNIAANTFNYGSYGFTSADQGIMVSSGRKKVYIDFMLGRSPDDWAYEVPLSVKFRKGENFESEFIPKLRQAINDSMFDGVVCTNLPIGATRCEAGFFFNDGDEIASDVVLEASDAPAKYVLSGDLASDGEKATSAIFNGGVNTKLKVSDAITLYQDYLSDAVKNNYVTVSCGMSEAEMTAAGYKAFTMVRNGAKEQCGARVLVTTAKYNGLTADRVPDVTGLPIDIETMLDRLTALVVASNLSESTMQGITGVDSNQAVDNGTLATGDECYDAGVEGVSWILCPAIDNMSSTTDGLEQTLEDMLSVPVGEYGAGSAAEAAWNICRNLANGVIIALLIAVIFSQLTGFGIDNYGIKKTLPRLILVAILLNLSFIICELAVDLSNIVGSGLSNMFKNIGNDLYGGFSVGQFIQTIVGGLLAVAAGVGASSGVIAPIVMIGLGGAGPMIILSLVLSLLVALLAVVFFFITVAARKIIIIVCIAMAPLAFACYILPNTQSIFKRWWSIFKGALIVYPICGALYGLSFVIRGMVFSGRAQVSFSEGLIAIFAPFLPFFLMPTLLRGSLSAIGSIGSAISSIGGGVRRGIGQANSRIRETGAYKSETEMQRRGVTNWRAGYDRDGKKIENISRWGKMIRGGDRGMASARVERSRNIVTAGNEAIMMGAGADAAEAQAYAEVADNRMKSELASIQMNTAKLNNGNIVNGSDLSSIGQYHRDSLLNYDRARTDEERDLYAARIKAAQSLLMAGGDKGRAAIYSNFQGAAANGRFSAIRMAAGSIASAKGAMESFKSGNRGEHRLINDLTSKEVADETIQRRVGNEVQFADGARYVGDYSVVGTDKYEPASLVKADDGAIQGLVDGMAAGAMNAQQISDIRSTAARALEMQEAKQLGIKPEVETQMRKLATMEEYQDASGQTRWLYQDRERLPSGETRVVYRDAFGKRGQNPEVNISTFQKTTSFGDGSEFDVPRGGSTNNGSGESFDGGAGI